MRVASCAAGRGAPPHCEADATRAGYKAAGDAQQLEALCAAAGVACRVLRLQGTQARESETSSSSKVRACLAAGDMRGIHAFLERAYAGTMLAAGVRQLPDDTGASPRGDPGPSGAGTDALFELPEWRNQEPGEGRYEVVAQGLSSGGESGAWAASGSLTLAGGRRLLRLPRNAGAWSDDSTWLRLELRARKGDA